MLERGSQPAREPTPTEQCRCGQDGEPLDGEGTAIALEGPAPALPCEGGGPSTHATRWPAAEGTPRVFATLMDTAGFEPSDGDVALSLSATDAGPSKRKVTKEAKANVDDLRRKLNNTVWAATRVGRALVALGMRMVALGTRSENGVGSFEDELKEADETHTEDDEWSICSLADSAVEGKKNLNDASRKELSKIPTIGKVLSKRIQEGQPYRGWIDVRALPQVGPVRIAELQKAFYLVHTHS